jgi:hypothetical protein
MDLFDSELTLLRQELALFSPNDLDKKKIFTLLDSKTCTPKDVVDVLSEEPFLKRQFERDSGVWEGYTLGEHTRLVLTQFETYFAPRSLPQGVTPRFFRVFLALHDIGKPISLILGDKKKQHAVSLKIIPLVLEALGFSEPDKKLALGLVDGDHIGAVLRHRLTPAEGARILRENAKSAQRDVQEFFEILSTYYLCDAGSYTEDAGGKKSLDHIFTFDRAKPELKLAAEFQPLHADLAKCLFSL